MDAHEIARLCETTEAAGWAGLFSSTPPRFAKQVRLSVRRFDSGVRALACAGIGQRVFNRAMNIGIGAPLTETQLDEVIAHYVEAGVGLFVLQICPAAQPESLPSWLLERGFTHAGEWAKMYREAAPPPPMATDLRILEIGADRRDVYAQTLCASYGMPEYVMPMVSGAIGQPGWHNYLAYDGDQPAAIGALHVQGDVGWLGGGGTIPAFRRRGAQGALLARRIADGIALGCQWFVTETGADSPERPNPSFHNMLRTGFQLGYLRADYVSPVL